MAYKTWACFTKVSQTTPEVRGETGESQIRQRNFRMRDMHTS